MLESQIWKHFKNSVKRRGSTWEISTLSRLCSLWQWRQRVCFCVFRDTSSSESEETSDSSDDELIGPPLPLKMVEEPVSHMEEEIIGPLPPPPFEEVEEDDDDDGDSEEEDVSISVR